MRSSRVLLERADAAVGRSSLARTRWKQAPSTPSYLWKRIKDIARYESLENIGAVRLNMGKLAITGGMRDKAYGPGETVAYTCFDVVPRFGVLDTIFQNLPKRSFQPKTMLDFGSGPGTAVLAAQNVWGASLERLTAVEPSLSMWQMSGALMKWTGQDGEPPKKLNVAWTRSLPKLLASESNAPHDLVVASFSLSELQDERARELALEVLWEKTADDGILVVVENGDKEGGRIVKHARSCFTDGENSFLANSEGYIVAPCPHSRTCPFAREPREGEPRHKTRWCHFLQETERLVTTISRKGQGRGATSSVSDYAYFAVSKGSRENDNGDNLSVVMFPPMRKKRRTIIDACTPGGSLERHTVTKSNPELYRAVRKASWGGRVCFSDARK